MRQISPESEGIFDLITGLYKAVDGDWDKLGQETGVSSNAVKLWLEYAAGVLGNAGNYKVKLSSAMSKPDLLTKVWF